MWRGRRGKKVGLPSALKANIASSLRTAWTTSICLALMWAAPWSGPLTYISPTISAVSAANMTLGMWMKSCWSVLVANIWSSLVGTALGLCYMYPPLQMVLLFLTLCWANRTSYFDQLGKVIASLGLVLGALFPHVSAGLYSGATALSVLLSVILIPFLITGFALLFPLPSLALMDGGGKALVVVNKLKKSSSMVLMSFSLPDDADFLGSRVDRLLEQAKTVLSELQTLLAYAEMEVVIFPTLATNYVSLKNFVPLANQCVSRIRGMKSMLQRVINNKTTQAFAERMHSSVESLVREIDDLFDIFFQQYSDYWAVGLGGGSSRARHGPGRISGIFAGKNRAHHSGTFDIDVDTILIEEGGGVDADIIYQAPPQESPRSHTQGSPEKSSKALAAKLQLLSVRLLKKRDVLITAYGEARADLVWARKDRSDIAIFAPPAAAAVAAAAPAPAPAPAPATATATETTASDSPTADVLLEKAIEDEIQRLSIRNLGPRGAFLHRLSLLVDLIASSRSMEIIEPGASSIPHWTLVDFLGRQGHHAADYFRGLGDDFQWGVSLLLPRANPDRSVSDEVVEALKSIVQPCKIAGAIVLTSLLVVIPSSQGVVQTDGPTAAFLQTGLWAAVVVALIRQDNTSSSFLTGYQRLEGTVIGAIFAFFVYRVFGDSTEVTLPVIVVWLSICAFFRNGARHGYAAVVAGFTPMVLLLGEASPTIDRAYDRIEKTFIGIGIYLIIDNLVFPVKLEDGVRASTLGAIAAARTFADQSIQGIERLMKEIEFHERQRAQSLRAEGGGELDDGPALSLRPAVETLSDEDFAQSQESIKQACGSLDRVQQFVTTGETLLKLAVHEPAIFSKPFPTAEYGVLFGGLAELCHKGSSLLMAIEGFHAALQTIRLEEDQVLGTILNLSYMARNLCEMQSSVDLALFKAYNALRLLFETGEVGVGFSDICSLSRALEQLLDRVDEHFRIHYAGGVGKIERTNSVTVLSVADLSLSPLLAWQNVFESSCELVKAIATLGNSISLVRDSEV